MSPRSPAALATLACLVLAALALALAGPAGEGLQLATRAVRLKEPGLVAASSPGYVVATVLLSVLVVAQTVYVARRRRS